MNHSLSLKGDINRNGKIDNDKEERANITLNAKDIQGLQTELSKLKRKIAFTGINNKHNEFASSAKIAEELTDGKQRVFFNNVGKSVVFKNGNKSLSSCVQIGSNDNSISNVNHIHFNNGSTLKGLADSVLQIPVDNEDKKYYVPTINLVETLYDDTTAGIIGNVADILNRTHDINYNENIETTTIAHDLSINGDINCNWLDDEFAKYALLSHQHEFADIYKNITVQGQNGQSTTTTKTLQQVLDEYEQSMTTAINGKANVSHQHEMGDIYRQTIKKVLNEDTGEEEDVVETKTLQEVFTEYEENLTTAINGKADWDHYHEIGDIYKNIIVQGQNGQNTTTHKKLETYIIERENDIKALINGKANSSHTHNATEINYTSGMNVKQALDSLNNQLDISDSQGHKLDILSILFGVGAAVGTAIDGGLVAAVGTLQNEVAVLQGEVATLGAEGLTSDVMDAVDEAGDIVQGGNSIWDGIKGIANAWSKFRTAAKGYINISSIESLPLEDIPIA